MTDGRTATHSARPTSPSTSAVSRPSRLAMPCPLTRNCSLSRAVAEDLADGDGPAAADVHERAVRPGAAAARRVRGREQRRVAIRGHPSPQPGHHGVDQAPADDRVPDDVSRFRVTVKSGHVVCRGSGGFWGSGRIAVRASVRVGQVFGQADYGGLRSAALWATDDLHL
jgi:hypothetical protein